MYAVNNVNKSIVFVFVASVYHFNNTISIFITIIALANTICARFPTLLFQLQKKKTKKKKIK